MLLLERVILVFLVIIGTALIAEAFLPRHVPALLLGSPRLSSGSASGW